MEESVRVDVAESDLEGVLTRKVEKVFSKFGLENISASELSRIAKKLGENQQGAETKTSRIRGVLK